MLCLARTPPAQVILQLSAEEPPHARVQRNAHEWRVLNDSYVANVARTGLLLEWIEGFSPDFIDSDFWPSWKESRPNLPQEVDDIITNWERRGIIKRVDRREVKACSPIFAIPKKETGQFRLITNLRGLNAFLHTTYFHLPSLQQICPFLQQGHWGASIDIKDAYLHWPISERDKPMLCFEYLGKYFQHQSLPFGLAVAPREWQRAMQAVVKYMRQMGATIWVYLDDFLILGASKEIVASNVAILLELLASLG